MSEHLITMDNTKRNEFITCPRKYFYKYIQGYSPTIGSTALRFGLSWHACMEGYYGMIAKEGWTTSGKAITAGGQMAQDTFYAETKNKEYYDDYRTIDNVLKMFILYLDHFSIDQNMLKIIQTEQVFKILITPTITELAAFPGVKPFYFSGKKDLEVELNGQPWIFEFKTTGQPISIQSKRLHRSPQIIGYNYASKVIAKEIPEGSLVVLCHASGRRNKSGEYGKIKFDFQRSPQIFSDQDLAEFRYGLVHDAWRLQTSHNKDFWPCNQYSCYTYGACPYTYMCEAHRPVGQELLVNHIQCEPWSVLHGEKDLVVKEESTEAIAKWNTIQQKLFGV